MSMRKGNGIGIDFDINPINDQGMNSETKIFPKHACQFCGSECKLVETLIDDEFFWDEVSQMYQPNKFMDNFEHTGNNRCSECGKEWTGM